MIQLSTEPKKTRKQQKKQNQTKQTTRTETESQKGLSTGEWEGGKVHRISSINGR